MCFIILQGAALQLSTSTPCTDRFAALSTWSDYLEAVGSVPHLVPSEDCRTETCSPTAADRGGLSNLVRLFVPRSSYLLGHGLTVQWCIGQACVLFQTPLVRT